MLLAGVLVVVGALVAALPWFPGRADWMAAVHPLWGGLIMLAGPVMLGSGSFRDRHFPVLLSLLSVYLIVVVHLGVFRTGAPAYDLRAVSDLIARVQVAGHPVANLAPYHGQFHFYGRLVRPLHVMEIDQAGGWGRDHPDGYLVAYYRDTSPDHPGAVYTQPFRSGSLAVWRGAQVAAEPGLLP